ncbi:alpha-2A adrenergic receptor-like [Nelusetta ayraudi]|uniref:alpha-2A adrenergic receptor-like n=1 Tax=Nelusetta ayraudi TaxID=303726 RepID=UPI003F717AC1
MVCLNSTSGNETLPGEDPYTVQTSAPLVILVSFLIVMTVFGNVMVVIAVNTSRALRAPQNFFLVSLACADILVATSVMPFSLANELMGYWYFGKVWCEIYLALDVFFCTSSIVHLCAISLDRYWSVSKAIEHNQRRTPRRIRCTVITVWALAAVISFPPLITMKKKDGETSCPQCKINDEQWYIIFSSIASFFAPCVIMVTVYVRIYLIAKKRTRDPPGERHRRQCLPERREEVVEVAAVAAEGVKDEGAQDNDGPEVDEDASSFDGNDTVLCSRVKKKGTRAAATAATATTAAGAQVKPGEASAQAGARAGWWKERQHRERRFTFVLAVVMGVFVLCWFPFFFTYTLTAVWGADCVPETLFKMFFWFGYCNSSLNPVIYTVFNQDFRRSFKKILCKSNGRGL